MLGVGCNARSPAAAHLIVVIAAFVVAGGIAVTCRVISSHCHHHRHCALVCVGARMVQCRIVTMLGCVFEACATESLPVLNPLLPSIVVHANGQKYAQLAARGSVRDETRATTSVPETVVQTSCLVSAQLEAIYSMPQLPTVGAAANGVYPVPGEKTVRKKKEGEEEKKAELPSESSLLIGDVVRVLDTGKVGVVVGSASEIAETINGVLVDVPVKVCGGERHVPPVPAFGQSPSPPLRSTTTSTTITTTTPLHHHHHHHHHHHLHHHHLLHHNHHRTTTANTTRPPRYAPPSSLTV